MNCIVIAPGPSMTQALADRCRGNFVLAVNDAYNLAPWCDGLVANDRAWWRERPDVKTLQCRKFSTNKVDGVEKVDKVGSTITSGSNSGLLALWVARNLGATDILLLGFDMKGSHFFGLHTNLPNTTESRFGIFQHQFAEASLMLRHDGIRVTNCTEGSALRAFPIGDLGDELKRWKQSPSPACES